MLKNFVLLVDCCSSLQGEHGRVNWAQPCKGGRGIDENWELNPKQIQEEIALVPAYDDHNADIKKCNLQMSVGY